MHVQKLISYLLYLSYRFFNVSRDSSVGIETGYMLDGRGSIPGRAIFFSSPYFPDWTPIEWVPEALSQGVKRPGREANHTSPFSSELKNIGGIHPLPHTSSWHSAQLIKHRDNFTFCLHTI
jgi:hypothetical protein